MDIHNLLWQAEAAAALRHIARNEEIKEYIRQNTPLYDILLRVASRYIGGEELSDCLGVAAELNRQGIAVTIDHMGESTRNVGMARLATDEFLKVINKINVRGLSASISLDLSHIGLAVDADLALENGSQLAKAAVEAGIELMISMEGSERADSILTIHQRLCGTFKNVGITLQAYLYRTKDDLLAAMDGPGRIRLVKGAYQEPAKIARIRGEALDSSYRDAMQLLLACGHLCSIATHDMNLLNQADEYVRQEKIDPSSFEFEMLHGVAFDSLQSLKDRGYQVRDFLPYGKEWYLYVCHRLAEYPPNILRAVKDAVGSVSPGDA